jgi:hypothetical protein
MLSRSFKFLLQRGVPWRRFSNQGESAVLWTNPTPTDSFSGSEIESGLPVSYEDISRAMFRIRSGVKNTQNDYSHFLSEICGVKVYIKKDFMQFTGSFKERYLLFQ